MDFNNQHRNIQCIRTSNFGSCKIGWVPASKSINHPADRRRFGFFLNSYGLSWEYALPQKSYDVVIISQAADISIWSEYNKGKVIFDFCDSYLSVPIFSFYDVSKCILKTLSRQVKKLSFSYTKLLQNMCKRADAIVCGSIEQQIRISKYSNNIYIIYDIHDEFRNIYKREYQSSSPFHIFWEGLPAFKGLKQISPILESFNRKQRICIHLATDLKYKTYMRDYVTNYAKKQIDSIFSNIHTYLYEWNSHMLPYIATACDIGIIPLSIDNNMHYEKAPNKLLLLWRLGIPTLTTRIPSYQQLMNECNLQMTCNSDVEWLLMLNKYSNDYHARKNSGIQAKNFVESTYSTGSILASWIQVLDSVL